MKKLAIVGIFFDGYHDIWEDFLNLVQIKWKSCKYPIYIVNGEQDILFESNYNVTVIHAGSDAEYSKKVQTAINNIDADYYLLLLEDFFFEKELPSDVLDEILDKMVANNIYYLRMPLKEFLPSNRRQNSYPIDMKTGFRFIPKESEYTVSCQPSIWERQFLKECIGTRNYNAWIFEGMYLYSKYAHTEEFLSKCRVSFDNILHLRHGAVQGKMLPEVYSDFKKQGYSFRNKREVLDAAAMERHNKKQRIKALIPKPLQRIVKRFIKTDSVVEKFKDAILVEMKEIGLE